MNQMAGLLAALTEIGSTGAIVFLRLAAVAFVLPAFGEQVVPLRLRLGAAAALTFLVTPIVAPGLPLPPPSPGWFLLTETVIGLTLGLTLRLMVMALQMAGSMAAQATSLAQIFGGHAVDAMPAMAHVMVFGGLALLAASGYHVKLVLYLAGSYELMPAGQLPTPASVAEWGVSRTARAFGLAFSLAGPFVIASVIYNLALGVINRAMPQLMVAFVGAPAITAGALALLVISLPYMLGVWLRAVDSLIVN